MELFLLSSLNVLIFPLQISAANLLPLELLRTISLKQAPSKVLACSDVEITNRKGVISSPNYPQYYPNHVSCSWHIHGNVGESITLSLDDIDIEESGICDEPPCCLYNWIKIRPFSNDSEKQFCGQNAPYYPIILTSSAKVTVKFHISKYVKGGRGFRMYYMVAPRKRSDIDICDVNEMQCDNKECVPSEARCNGKPDCVDNSDEHYCSNLCHSGRSCLTVYQCYDATKRCDGIIDCPDFTDEIDCGLCPSNLTHCGHDSTQCYNPTTQRCDRVLDCSNGEDEKDCAHLCPGKILCSSGLGCYSMSDRCNGIAQCGDSSDEKNCSPNLCNYERGGFLCNNGHCIREVWKCDRTNDCGDGSDENDCLRNSVLTAAITGSLICALLLVIAISCTCRLHALRILESRLASRETPLSRMSREFFFREPPPSYAAAVGHNERNLYIENSHYTSSSRHSSRRCRRSRSRRCHGSRRRLSDDQNCVLVSSDSTMHPPEILLTVSSPQHSGISNMGFVTQIPDPGMRNNTDQGSSHKEEHISRHSPKLSTSRSVGDDKDSSSDDGNTFSLINQSLHIDNNTSHSSTITTSAISSEPCTESNTTYEGESDTDMLIT